MDQESVQPSSSSEERGTEREGEIKPEESDLGTVGGVLDGNLNDERRQRNREGQIQTQSHSLLSTHKCTLHRTRTQCICGRFCQNSEDQPWLI